MPRQVALGAGVPGKLLDQRRPVVAPQEHRVPRVPAVRRAQQRRPGSSLLTPLPDDPAVHRLADVGQVHEAHEDRGDGLRARGEPLQAGESQGFIFNLYIHACYTQGAACGVVLAIDPDGRNTGPRIED